MSVGEGEGEESVGVEEEKEAFVERESMEGGMMGVVLMET